MGGFDPREAVSNHVQRRPRAGSLPPQIARAVRRPEERRHTAHAYSERSRKAMPRCMIVRIFAVTLFATLVPCTHGQQSAAPAPQKPHDSHAGHTAATPSAPAAHEMKPAHAADAASLYSILSTFY